MKHHEQFHNILVRGGRTGKKLHHASNGSSVLGCGHWTRHHVCHFQVADDVEPETLQAFIDKGHELCEKCFPQYATESKPAAYTGPKTHINRGRPMINDAGKIVLRRFQGTGCGRRNQYGYKYMEFKKVLNESPERVCSGCKRYYDELKTQVKSLKEKQS